MERKRPNFSATAKLHGGNTPRVERSGPHPSQAWYERVLGPRFNASIEFSRRYNREHGVDWPTQQAKARRMKEREIKRQQRDAEFDILRRWHNVSLVRNGARGVRYVGPTIEDVMGAVRRNRVANPDVYAEHLQRARVWMMQVHG